MSSQKRKLSNALQIFIDAVERLSEEDFEKLCDKSYNIEIQFIRKRSKENTTSTIKECDLGLLIEKLTAFSSREEAQQFLIANCATRKSLEPIAKNLDIPILRQDKVEILRDKIIESTVGARIRSQAIRGEND